MCIHKTGFLTLAIGAFLLLSSSSFAQQPRAQITSDGTYRYVTSNGIPNHKTGAYPNVKNPNYIRANNFRFRIPLEPRRSNRPTPADQSLFFGVAINGVPFDAFSEKIWNRSPVWRYEDMSDKVEDTIDQSNGDASKLQLYVYKGIPKPLVKKSLSHVGYAADGFPIFISKENRYKSSYRLKKGNRAKNDQTPQGPHDGQFANDYEFVPGSGNLDQCNGVTVNNKYYIYIVTQEFPYIPRCWSGRPDRSFIKSFATRPQADDPKSSSRAIPDTRYKDRMIRSSR